MISSIKQQRIATAFVLSGILSVSSGMTLIGSASAIPAKTTVETSKQILRRDTRNSGLPRSVAVAIYKDLSRREGSLPNKINIVEYKEAIWNNGCLELSQPGELCTQAIVPGWQVVVSNGKENWVYHSNKNGRMLRLADSKTPDSNKAKLPANVREAVLKAAARRLRVRVAQLNIIQSEQRDWKDGCLELAEPGRICSQQIVPGWRVVVGIKEQALVYHTNDKGTNVRFNQSQSDTGNKEIPTKARDAVLKAASEYTNLPVSRLRIVDVENITVDGCLSLPKPGEACTKIALSALKVTVEARKQRLVYHTKLDGSQVRLNLEQSNVNLPQSVANAVLSQASQYLSLPRKGLNIVSYKRKELMNECQTSSFPNACDGVDLLGWEVVVEGSNGRRLIYEADNKGSQIRLAGGDIQNNTANLPKDIADKVLTQASQQSGIPISRLRVVAAERKQWPDACLGINKPGTLCAQVVIPGWQVTVSDGEQRWVYRIGETVSISYDEDASKIAGQNGVKVIPIPTSELPPALTDGVIFRQVASGGIAGLTYETILLDDGRLIRTRMGDANDSERRIYRISKQQMQQFQDLLEEQEKVFQNVSYPASSNAADYMVYTLTAPKGTVQFNDISRRSLPNNLQLVLKVWNEINSSTIR